MRSRELIKLTAGFKRFRENIYVKDTNSYDLSKGQSPKTLIIGCSDSRVDPAILSSAGPGEIFVVRNVANLVPPFEASNVGYHGVSAAIEFAVETLKVENIIVLGHRQCGGISALVSKSYAPDSFVGHWMSIAKVSYDRILKKYPTLDHDNLCRHCEMESIVNSLENLKSFPFVRDAVKTRSLNLLGIYFDLERGELFEFDERNEVFKVVDLGVNNEPKNS